MARVRSSSIEGVAAAFGKPAEEFVIVEITKDGPKPVYDHDGQLLTFRDGAAAAKEAAARTGGGKKFQPRRVKDDGWRERELSRFASKEYQPLPWSDHMWWKAHEHIHGSHYPHVSQKNSVGLMAFTENDEKGSADIQTAIKPGKYLERFFSDVLDPYIIRDLSTVFSNKFEDNCLLFVDNEDEFEELYTKGPSSCMSHPTEKYASHIHPVRVYAAGDLKLAYMKRDGRVVARTLVYPAKKRYSRIYGDVGRIEPLLTKEGYSKGPPAGAKIQRVLTWQDKKRKTGNMAFVLPHIDDINWVTDEGDHLMIGDPNKNMPRDKGVKSAGANGLSEWVLQICACCQSEGKVGSMKAVVVDSHGHQQMWCAKCVKEKAITCKASSQLCVPSVMVEMYNGDMWWEVQFADRGFTCQATNKRYPRAMAVTYYEQVGGKRKSKVVNSDWYKANNGHRCETCGNPVIADCNDACKKKYLDEKAKWEKTTLYAKSTTISGANPFISTGTSGTSGTNR